MQSEDVAVDVGSGHCISFEDVKQVFLIYLADLSVVEAGEMALLKSKGENASA